MSLFWKLLVLLCSLSLTTSLRYDPDQIEFNLNQNETATHPLDYAGEWSNHTYNPSPANWRMPFYSFFIDRFVNGDPSNDDANGTAWEHDLMGTQLRHGGDIKGLQDSLDYLVGMGIRGVYIAGSLHINAPWSADSYSPLDTTLLDHHFGNIQAWRDCISEMHARGMYVVLDNTMATMGDLIGFEGYLNTSTPFSFREHNAVWKTDRRYHDYSFNNTELEVCPWKYPRFWGDDGRQYNDSNTAQMISCRDSEFDQYGEIEWQRQISKFAFVQDRLREWRPDVRAKIEHLSCLTIGMLDIDGFRMDKGIQITTDAAGNWSNSIRACAARYNKHNFFIPGELVPSNALGAVYLGRGKEPSMAIENVTEVPAMTYKNSHDSNYIRGVGQNAFDGAAFHYSTYRAMTRFLGLDGALATSYDIPVNWVQGWNGMVQTNDMNNAFTGEFDPRHMYGVTNQDVFRWPGIRNGTHRQNLGMFIITLQLPGISMLSWGEEQAFYIEDNTSSNYVFGRQSMSSATAWQTHGCYKVGNGKYYDWPVESALDGCKDDSVSLDHRDPSHPIRNIIKVMYEMRSRYPVLNDGFYLQQLSNSTHDVHLPGSKGVPTETGLWSTLRSRNSKVQDFTGIGQGNQSVWQIYQNDNITTYHFNCSDPSTALIAPFDMGTTVKNLFWPYDEYTLQKSPQRLGFENSDQYNGCLPAMNLSAWGYKAFVPRNKWLEPSPAITKFLPGHDHRILSNVTSKEHNTLKIEFHFSAAMDCDSVKNGLSIDSTTETDKVAYLNASSIVCLTVTDGNITDPVLYSGGAPTAWTFTATIANIFDGVHTVTVRNVTTAQKNASTNSVDHFLLRIGQSDNPMVFPKANYSKSLLHKDSNNDTLWVSHKAAGADKFRYSLNWGSSYSDWMPYAGGNTTLKPQAWSGTKEQRWKGDHVMVQYWSQKTGSSSHLQHGDVAGTNRPPRRFPHLFVHGAFNQFGYDAGLPKTMHQDGNGIWNYNFMTEWPAQYQLNVWGINPNGKPDVTGAFGDVDGDGIIDRIAPTSLEESVANVTAHPPAPFLAYRISLNDGSYRLLLTPVGSRRMQIVLFVLLATLPILSAVFGVWTYRRAFYQVKFNQIGLKPYHPLIPLTMKRKLRLNPWSTQPDIPDSEKKKSEGSSNDLITMDIGPSAGQSALAMRDSAPRRTVLIATMEYDIEDWGIKIKIGGLGVMAQLMGKNLGHQNLVWVVPCVGGIDYPMDQPAEPMTVTILGSQYMVKVQYHVLRNITYVLLDAPVFRQQTKAEPYPPRMDDIDSAVYYSAWNSCIAEALRRFPVDLYHINDYHGTIAQLHLLPQTIPCCLSLHNAEFQGLWPMRTPQEFDEVSRIFDLDPAIVKRYIQFGEVFNLLHAGASYLRLHQKGFGAVGVSKKYGKRSFKRYPIFWGLTSVGSLPNPDPSDTEQLNKDREVSSTNDVIVDQEYEASRGALRVQAQQWAGLIEDPTAELFVFVGRWSMQKGVDLIADVFPAILEENSRAQLICIGPVIDLYGKFAALKLQKMMEFYPGRVCSKPVFTALPPYIFSGAEFALIPSRDEPFGLVAVEFGRKGAIGVGSRVGGLGQMPGWWYTIESTTTKHLLHQFKSAITTALASEVPLRAIMRARSAKQRFPVAQWVEDLGILQARAIKMHLRQKAKSGIRMSTPGHGTPVSGARTPSRHWFQMGVPSPSTTAPPSRAQTRPGTRASSPTRIPSRHWFQMGVVSPSTTAPPSRVQTRPGTRASSPTRIEPTVETLSSEEGLSLGLRSGPGHGPPESRTQEVSKRIVSSSSLASLAASIRTLAGHGHRTSKSADLSAAGSISTVLGAADRIHRTDAGQLPGIDEASSIAGALHPPAIQNNPDSDEYVITAEQVEDSIRAAQLESLQRELRLSGQPFQGAPWLSMHPSISESRRGGVSANDGTASPGRSSPGEGEAFISGTTPTRHQLDPSSDVLDLKTIIGGREDFDLQNVAPFFNDPTGQYFDAFTQKLDILNGKTSEGPLCIEDYLMRSEKQWFDRYHQAKMAKSGRTTGVTTRAASPAVSIFRERMSSDAPASSTTINEFLIRENYIPPTGIEKLMRTKIGDWPIYSFLLALGQIIAANSYQITLLTGQVGQTAGKLYIVATIYLLTSIMWWVAFRRLKSLYTLTTPFALYGLAFFLIGLAPYCKTSGGRGWIQNVATGLYAGASSSGSFFFALNFGSEGSVPTAVWSFRACVIQGSQQIYVILLWFWGSKLTQATTTNRSLVAYDWTLTAIGVPIAVLLWAVGIILFLGLPEYYRQSPGRVPSFYRSILRRKIILWFFVAVVLQNFFLSATVGRNWQYLWSSKHAPAWSVVILVLVFFIGIWALALWLFGTLSKSHSWILPIFAVSLGAPRWCQMLWGTSNIGLYVPWAGSYVAGALLGRSLWLWLGVLDAIQGVGFGMILLQTLTRFHLTFTLICAQVLGSLATIIARAYAPNNIGPGPIFPDFSAGYEGLRNAWFWVGMMSQLIVCVGFFMFFRKEQLNKP